MRCIIFGIVALIFAWIPVVDALKDAIQQKRTYRECLSECWGCWIRALEDKIA